MPPEIREKYFSGNYYVKKFGHFSGKNHVKFGNFVNFSGMNHIKFWHFVILYIGPIGKKCRAPSSLSSYAYMETSPTGHIPSY